MLELLQAIPDIETHLIMSGTAKLNIRLETDWHVKDIEALASHVHDVKAAAITPATFMGCD